MKKLAFTMDDFGIHESISYQLRDMLRFKFQKMYDENIIGFEDKLAELHNKNFVLEQRAIKFESLYQALLQGGTLDSGRVDSPTGSSGEVRDVPDQN